MSGAYGFDGKLSTMAGHQEAKADAEKRKARCDDCGHFHDVRPSVREKYMGDSGNGWAFHDVPVRVGNLCAECREERGAVPEGDF